MDEKDRLLLTLLQNGLSLTSRPFDALSAKTGVGGAEILLRIQRLKREGAFRDIKAILDPRAFRYQGAWVAARTRHEDFARYSEVFGKHPGVLYGCERDSDFNFWFFIAVPAEHDLELHVRCLEKIAGVERGLFLPSKKVFKSRDPWNSLDAGIFSVAWEHSLRRQTEKTSALSAEAIAMIRRLQEPFPFTDEPYQKIALDLGITETEVLGQLDSLQEKGYLKRIGIFQKQAAIPSSEKILVVWQIPEEKIEQVGTEIAGFKEISCVDQRLVLEEFPYSLYATVQIGMTAELEVLIKSIQDRIGKWPYRVLATDREFSREGIRYFPKDMDAWWHQNRRVIETAF
ncbi:MAG: hypothetical protein V1882_08630 [Candidatus Omnitrophota bacterium]